MNISQGARHMIRLGYELKYCGNKMKCIICGHTDCE